jgi:hypothetical protein
MWNSSSAAWLKQPRATEELKGSLLTKAVFVLLVPELTRSADIKLNGQLSLRGYAFAIASAYRRDNVAADLHWQSRQAITTRLAPLFRTWRTTGLGRPATFASYRPRDI